MSELWGGRFREPLDAAMRRFSTSLPVDRRLVREDLAGSRAHAEALRSAGVLSGDEHDELVGAFAAIEQEVEDGAFPPTGGEENAAEDIHSAVETRLVELVGDTGRRLHAGRSRNDQVVTDVLLWLKHAGVEVEQGVRAVQAALVDRAEAHLDLVVPAYTHLQQAQPVLLAHHLLAHFEALDRDLGRLRDARRRADRCPLGAGACAGSTLAIDRRLTAELLGFARVSENSIEAAPRGVGLPGQRTANLNQNRNAPQNQGDRGAPVVVLAM